MSNYTSADVPESSRVVIDPVTRIEGHLRVEMEAGDGVIKNAWTSTTPVPYTHLTLPTICSV